MRLFHLHLVFLVFDPTDITASFIKRILLSSNLPFIRGGSNAGFNVESYTNAAASSAPPSQTDHDQSKPILDVDSIAAALRLTCDINHRLVSIQNYITTPSFLNKYAHTIVDYDFLQKVDPSLGIHRIPLPTLTERKNKRHMKTIFHAKLPLDTEKVGIERWGIDIKSFIQLLAKTCHQLLHDSTSESLHSDHHQLETRNRNQIIIFALALIYLDRSYSLETHRTPVEILEQLDQFSHEHDEEHRISPPIMSPRILSILPSACPFMMPRTIHNLVLTAVVLACRTVYSQPLPQPPPPSLWSWWDCHLNHENVNDSNLVELENTVVDNITKQYCMHLQQNGILIEPLTLYRMQIAMMGALGSGGLYVDPPYLVQFLRKWKNIFGGVLPDSMNNHVFYGHEFPPNQSTVMMTESVTSDSTYIESSTIIQQFPSRYTNGRFQDEYLGNVWDNFNNENI